MADSGSFAPFVSPLESLMPRKQHRVHLTPTERQSLHSLLQRGTAPALTQRHARILLKADARWSDARVADAVECSTRTVARVRADWADRGLACIDRRSRCRTTPPKLDPVQTDQLIALATSTPPDGHARWTVRLLASRAIELEITETLSYETVRRTLKKGGANPGRSSVL
jgi:hypothetical protein